MGSKIILVPIDGSRFSEWAVPTALSLARRLEAGVELVSVYEDEPRVGGWLVANHGAKEWFEEYHQTLLESICRSSDVVVASTILRGAVPKDLEAYVERVRPELVVMSTHGRGALSRAWLGSVADTVVRHVTVPVLLVRPQETEPALEEGTPVCRVLIPLDGSPRAEQSLSVALRVGRDRCAKYALVRVVPPQALPASPYLPHAAEETHQRLERGRLESEKYLADLKQRLVEEELAVETEVLVGVHPARGIVHYAEEHDFDLIVIATHGRGGLTRLVLGSVADKVVRASPIHVLVHRPVDH